MKRYFLIFALLLLLVAPSLAQNEDQVVIGFMQIVTHPALDAARDGAIEVLNAAGYVDGENARFLFGNGEGDIPTLATIAQNFIDEGADIIMAISTPALQAAYSAALDLGDQAPVIIFNAVTSPYAAGIADAPCIHPPNVIGTQALSPYAQIMPLIFDVAPDATKVGYMYNPAEANSVVITGIVEPLAEDLGIDLVEQTISNSSEVPTAAEALVSKGVQAFFIATDNTVVTGLEGLVAVANENGIPLVASDTDSAPRGAVVASGLNYWQDGRDAGLLAVGYLEGELDVANAKINRQLNTDVAVNLDVAEEQGATISDDLLARAAIVIKDGNVEASERAAFTADDLAEQLPDFVKNATCTQEDIDMETMALTATPASE